MPNVTISVNRIPPYMYAPNKSDGTWGPHHLPTMRAAVLAVQEELLAEQHPPELNAAGYYGPILAGADQKNPDGTYTQDHDTDLLTLAINIAAKGLAEGKSFVFINPETGTVSYSTVA